MPKVSVFTQGLPLKNRIGYLGYSDDQESTQMKFGLYIYIYLLYLGNKIEAKFKAVKVIHKIRNGFPATLLKSPGTKSGLT